MGANEGGSKTMLVATRTLVPGRWHADPEKARERTGVVVRCAFDNRVLCNASCAALRPTVAADSGGVRDGGRVQCQRMPEPREKFTLMEVRRNDAYGERVGDGIREEL